MCVGALSPRFFLMVAAVVAATASFFAIFLASNPAVFAVPSTVEVVGGIVLFLVVVLASCMERA